MSQHSSPGMKSGRSPPGRRPIRSPTLTEGAALRTERHAALDRSRAELGEQGIVGHGLGRLILLIARQSAHTAKVAQDAAVDDGRDRDDVLVRRRNSFVEGRWRERTLAREHAVQHQRSFREIGHA